jgi:hypothetical protein
MPSFDSYKSIGTGFRNFGYYWAPNDYMDEKILVNFLMNKVFISAQISSIKKGVVPDGIIFSITGEFPVPLNGELLLMK